MSESNLHQFAQEPVVGAAEAEIDHVGLLIDREIQRLGQAEAIAHRRRTRPRLRLPTCAEAKQTRAWGHPRDSDAIVFPRRDHASDTGAMLVARQRLAG